MFEAEPRAGGERIPFAALAQPQAIFSADPRFMGGGLVLAPSAEPAPPAPAGGPDPDPDPIHAAWVSGFAEGHAAAEAEAAVRAAEDTARLEPLRIACAKLDAVQTDALAAALREAVLALCAGVLDEAAQAPESLERRTRAAAAMLARADDDRVIRLHPDDLALIGPRLPADWAVAPDPTLARGALRVDGRHGGIDDGPEQWRAALAQALDAC